MGTDYWGYLSIFELIAHDVSGLHGRFELGFLFVARFVSSIGLTANDMLFVFSALTIFLFIDSIRKAGYNSASASALALLLLLGVGPVFSSANIVRQGLALALTAYICISYGHKRFFATGLAASIGLLFHYSAPIVLFFNLVPRKVIVFRYWLFCSLFVVLLADLIFNSIFEFLVVNSVVFFNFDVYLSDIDNLKTASGLGVRIAFDLILFLFLSLFSKRLDSRAVWIFNLAFVGALLSYVFKDYAIFLRAVAYFDVFKYLALPWFYFCFYGIFRNIYVVFIIFYSFFTFVRSATSEQFYPYGNIFFV